MADEIEKFEGPSVEHDDLIGHIEARAREQHARTSDAGESGAKTDKFLEETGLNGQALKWIGSIVKKLPKKDGQMKAMDIIRSLELILPMAKAHVEGQGTGEMNLGPDTNEEETEEDSADADIVDAEEVDDGDDDTVTAINFAGDDAA